MGAVEQADEEDRIRALLERLREFVLGGVEHQRGAEHARVAAACACDVDGLARGDACGLEALDRRCRVGHRRRCRWLAAFEQHARGDREWQRDGIAVIAAVPREGTLVYDLDLSGPLVFVLGAEGTGVPDEIAARADRRVRVPMRARVESLNVGVAGAILVYEAARQRGTIS